MSRVVEVIVTESRMVVARDGEGGVVLFNGYKVGFAGLRVWRWWW